MDGRGIIGNYLIERELGRGGMGVVYAARHRVLDRRAAIKLLLADTTARPDRVERFFNEARAAMAIQHPGIVQVYDVGIADDGRAYIAMEMLAGRTLTAVLERGPLPLRVAIGHARQIAEALAAAHAAGVVHRDLKPDNIFVVEGDQRIKLVDFGIAKLAQPVNVRTATGALIGTPLYMSPEQCEAVRELDARSDLYSLGCVMFAMLTGAPPFTDNAIAAHLHVAPPLLRTRCPSASPQLEAIVSTLLAKSRDDRFRDARAVIAALAQPGVDAITSGGNAAMTADAPAFAALRGAPSGSAAPATATAAPTPAPGPHGVHAPPRAMPGVATPPATGPHGTTPPPTHGSHGSLAGPHGTTPPPPTATAGPMSGPYGVQTAHGAPSAPFGVPQTTGPHAAPTPAGLPHASTVPPEAYAPAGPPSGPTQIRPAAADRPRRHGLWLALLGIAVMITVGITLLATRSPSTTKVLAGDAGAVEADATEDNPRPEAPDATIALLPHTDAGLDLRGLFDAQPAGRKLDAGVRPRVDAAVVRPATPDAPVAPPPPDAAAPPDAERPAPVDAPPRPEPPKFEVELVFERDSFSLGSSGDAAIDRVVATARAHPDLRLLLIAEAGDDETRNPQGLASGRANTVFVRLANRIARDRIEVQSRVLPAGTSRRSVRIISR